MTHCADQPISWLMLERYKLGELSEQKRTAIDHHLTQCEACARDLGILETDDRCLPPLPRMAPRGRVIDFVVGRPLWVASMTLATCVALFLISTIFFKSSTDFAQRPSRISFKGGDMALTVVRNREGVIKESPTHFATEDRFMVQVTHPLQGATDWEVVVFQSGIPSFPYADHPPIAPGNRVPVPGAFRLTDEVPALVCIMVGESLPSREQLREEGPRSLPEGTVCTVLLPLDNP